MKPSQLLLAISYYGILVPVGLFMKMLRVDPLRRRWKKSAPSYWTQTSNKDANHMRFGR